MANESLSRQDEASRQGASILHVFPHLTAKQREVLAFIAENRTSKEIAWELGISESAVNQRIEGVRTRAGSPPRAELARAYRQYVQDLDPACNPITDKNTQVPESTRDTALPSRDEQTGQFTLTDAVTYAVTAPSQRGKLEPIVPEVLDGDHPGLSRTAAMIVIAGGMLLVAMVGLGVVRALSHLV